MLNTVFSHSAMSTGQFLPNEVARNLFLPIESDFVSLKLVVRMR